MAMDRMQEEIDDFVNGDINEQVEIEVSRRYAEMVKRENNGKGYSYEDENKIKAQLRQEVRQQILEDKEFKRRYQEERHLDDLQDQQRRYDTERYQYTSDQMLDRWWNEKQAMQAEGRIYTDDINGINPNAVVNHYADIANYFNIRDTETMEKIIEGAQNGNIDGVAFRGLIENAEGKKMIEMMMRENNGNLNIEQLMDSISQLMKSNAESRVKTAEGYMDVAKKDLDARATGVERKVDALNKTTLTSVERDQAYFETVDNAYTQGMDSARRSEDEVMRRISLHEVEKATEGVRTSAINDNTRDIRQNQRAKDDRDDIEKE